ncbi:NAD(P)-binding domain-containing protein [Teredinibacter sp. KSP-S5-2]|uniref:NAD(P)-binding domain-containing protein n=1 Tax=Teredinibacter sp. KSP-S5-2 TaxID=3034506 RepID=UPI0029349FBC|nr:NAD(P)-binding domain-containing protein [Teredinibacter sp. KSP-S5-2]WNO11448.1 NAD(P)-binding domain-containing protein [Teredinibacter sp. KSP-S5-2]
MNELEFYLLFFVLPLLLIWLIYGFRQNQKHRRAVRQLNQAKEHGLGEPATLHPVIDPNRCLGCGTCVKACPEGEILGLINRKAVLIEPTACIGHGACMDACPGKAISLVFGSATRGVEIPIVSRDFETSVPGIYIAGELGGMGLIRNAIVQGQKAIEAIAKNRPKKSNTKYDLAIIGAGAAGLSASLAAKEKKINAITLEQDTVGGTIAHYPRGKVVMTQPAKLPLAGKFQFRETSKEELIDYFHGVLRDFPLNIKTGVHVEEITKIPEGFAILTNKGKLRVSQILLAMGRRGTPRKLDVPGEELPKVVYRLADPDQYIGKHVLVVGGGDSALEAAVAIAESPRTHVVLSYRSAAFSRAKEKNRQRIAECEKRGNLRVMLESTVVRIDSDSVTINKNDKHESIPNDAVIICAGGILPTPFLKKIGIQVEEKFGTA